MTNGIPRASGFRTSFVIFPSSFVICFRRSQRISPCANLTNNMHDPRFDKLAHGLVNFSTKLGKGDKVLIDTFDVPDEMTIALIRAARAAGAIPLVQTQHTRITREIALGAEEEQIELMN